MTKLYPYVLPLLRSVLFILTGLLLASLTLESLRESSQWWPLIVVAVNILTIIVLFLICRKEGVSFRTLIDRRKGDSDPTTTAIIIFIMILLGVGGMYGFGFLIYGFVPLTMIQPLPVWMAVMMIVLLPLTIVFAEFPLYFGYALNRIDERTHNKYFAIGYPMFFYALQHSFIPLLFNSQHIIYRFLAFLPLLMVLGIIYYKHRRLTDMMIGHAILDFLAVTQILMVSVFPSILEYLG